MDVKRYKQLVCGRAFNKQIEVQLIRQLMAKRILMSTNLILWLIANEPQKRFGIWPHGTKYQTLHLQLYIQPAAAGNSPKVVSVYRVLAIVEGCGCGSSTYDCSLQL
jgi:hypothetical protein